MRIHIDGFPDDLRAIGEAEIKEVIQAFGTFESIESLFDLTHIHEVIVTPNYEQTVRAHLRAEIGDIGNAYRATRHGIAAHGYTASRIEDGKIRFTIILAADSMGNWQESSRLWRLTTLYHEIFHSVRGKIRFEEKGASQHRDKWKPDDYFSFILKTATEEYMVDKLTDKFLKFVARDGEGQPFELHKTMVSGGWDYSEGAIAILNGMRAHFARDVRAFMLWQTDIQTLADESSLYIMDTVTVLAHFAATNDELGSWREVEARLKACNGHSRFLVDAWPAIHGYWRLAWGSDDEARLETASVHAQEAISSIFVRCGLELSELEDGTYINVNFPPTLTP